MSTTTGMPPLTQVTAAHTKAQLLDLLRTPVAVVSNTVFPTMAFLFFFLPQPGLADNPQASLVVVAQLGMFGVMSAFLFGYGIGVAEERANPWTTYLRTLPVGAVPATVARFVVAVAGAALSLLPLVVSVALLTEAPAVFVEGQSPWWRIPVGLATLLLGGTPFLAMGLLIGYSLSVKAAIAVAQVVNFPLAFIGGLMIPPQAFPAWLNTASLVTPARAARDLGVSAFTGADVAASTVPVLTGWSAALIALAFWATRRDQGRRFH